MTREHAVDEVDQATEQEMMYTERAIQKAREFKPEAEAVGACLNCGEKLAEQKRWCDFECMEDWSKRCRKNT